jgi:putative ABC transport system substrate-binding protein
MIMRRSVLLASILVVAASGTALAQIAQRHFRIGIFGFQPLGSVRTGTFAPLFDELRKLGYSEGANTTFEVRSAEGNVARIINIAAELVALKPDVIFASNAPSVIALKKTGTSIPVIFAQIGSDLVNLGVIESIPRPGGNFTGIVTNTVEIAAKRLELLKQLVPGVRRVAMFQNPLNPVSAAALEQTLNASGPMGIEIIPIKVERPDDIQPAIDRAVQAQAEALIKTDDAVTYINRQKVIELVQQYKLPTMFNYRVEAVEGGLISYGVDADVQYRRAAVYIDKILQGTKPMDLPVELATRVLLVINLKSADALGIKVPPILIARADEVIE